MLCSLYTFLREQFSWQRSVGEAQVPLVSELHSAKINVIRDHITDKRCYSHIIGSFL